MTGHRLTLRSAALLAVVAFCVAAIAGVCWAINLWSPR